MSESIVFKSIPLRVYASALVKMSHEWQETDSWNAKQEYEYFTSKRGWTDGELEKSLAEEILKGEFSIQDWRDT